MNKDLEEAMASAGFAISDAPPTQEAPTQSYKKPRFRHNRRRGFSTYPRAQPEEQQVETPQAEQPFNRKQKQKI